MPLAEIDGDAIAVYADFRDKEMVKKVPGVRWDKNRQAWTLRVSWAGCLQLRAVFGDSLQVGPYLSKWSRSEKTHVVDPCLELRSAQDAEGDPDLYPFQRAGVRFMATAGRALNADEMGLGKSVQTVMALEALGDDAYPALVVCPNSMKFVWEQEFARWAPGRRVSVAHGSAKKRREAIELVTHGTYDVVVINWESLRSHTRLAGYPSVNLTEAEKETKELNHGEQFATVVADEAHRGKDPRAKQTRALWYVGDRATNAFALSGTPVANSPEDCWSLMRFVSPDEYPVKTQWVDRYGLTSWSPFGSLQVVGLRAEHKDEFFRILDPRFIRRTKAAVLTQLPPKVYTTRTVDMGPKQRKAYDDMRKHMIAEIDGGVVLASSPLARLTRLTQFASATAEVGPDGNPVLTDPSCKTDALEEIAGELGGQKAVVVTQSVQLARMCSALLEKLGYRHGAITGDVPTPDRMEYIRRFQEADLQFMVVTLGAGGEGITLTAAQTMIRLQRSYSLVQNKQVEDRLHRIGQEGSVQIIDVVAEGTVEEPQVRALLGKEEMFEEVVRDRDTLRRWLD